jgi:hypothetical protein
MVLKEGVSALTEEELEEACKERGLETELSKEKLKMELLAWLEVQRSDPNAALRLLVYHYAYKNGDLYLSV